MNLPTLNKRSDSPTPDDDESRQAQRQADRWLITGTMLMGTMFIGFVGLPFFLRGVWLQRRAQKAGLSVRPIIVTLTFGIPNAIFLEAVLSFLGVGIQPPQPTWGQMVADGTTKMFGESIATSGNARDLATTFISNAISKFGVAAVLGVFLHEKLQRLERRLKRLEGQGRAKDGSLPDNAASTEHEGAEQLRRRSR